MKIHVRLLWYAFMFLTVKDIFIECYWLQPHPMRILIFLCPCNHRAKWLQQWFLSKIGGRDSPSAAVFLEELESELSDSTDVVVQRTSTDLHPANQVTLHRTRSERISGWYWMFCFHAFLSCSESRKRYMSVDEKDTTCPLIDRSMRTNTWPSAVLSRVRRTLLIVQQDRC